MEQGSPAAGVGLTVKDLITSINGEAMRSNDDFTRVISSLKPGDKAKVELVRAGSEKSLEVTLGQPPASEELNWNKSIVASVTAAPSDPFPYIARGVFDSDPNRSVRYFDRAIELDGKFASAYFERGKLHAFLEDYDRARADLQKVWQLTQNRELANQAKEELESLP